MKRAWTWGAVLGVGALAALGALGARSQAWAQGAPVGTTPVIVPVPMPAPPPVPQPPPQPMGGAPGNKFPMSTEGLHVTPLGPDVFVTVKDHGDAHTVTVFKVDAQGKLTSTDKKKFFY